MDGVLYIAQYSRFLECGMLHALLSTVYGDTQIVSRASPSYAKRGRRARPNTQKCSLVPRPDGSKVRKLCCTTIKFISVIEASRFVAFEVESRRPSLASHTPNPLACGGHRMYAMLTTFTTCTVIYYHGMHEDIMVFHVRFHAKIICYMHT